MPRKALVVDNDFFFVEFLSEQLESRGYEVIKAYDGMEGLSKLEEEPVDLIFVDLIMPRLDGKQLIRFARSRFPDAAFAIVALPIVEQTDGLKGIDADFFITKGPVEKMAGHLDALMHQIERKIDAPPPGQKLFQPDKLIPRQTTDELIQTVNFLEAVTEGIGVGVMVIDKNTRVINCNPLALEILAKPYADVLNRQMGSFLENDEKTQILGLLKKMMAKPDMKRTGVTLPINSVEIRVIVSSLETEGETTGWIMALCPV